MIVVRQYGLLPPTDWGEDCHEQLFLMNRLWNRLVEIEQEHIKEYRQLMGQIKIAVDATVFALSQLDWGIWLLTFGTEARRTGLGVIAFGCRQPYRPLDLILSS